VTKDHIPTHSGGSFRWPALLCRLPQPLNFWHQQIKDQTFQYLIEASLFCTWWVIIRQLGGRGWGDGTIRHVYWVPKPTLSKKSCAINEASSAKKTIYIGLSKKQCFPTPQPAFKRPPPARAFISITHVAFLLHKWQCIILILHNVQPKLSVWASQTAVVS